jgi:hypothetical protein
MKSKTNSGVVYYTTVLFFDHEVLTINIEEEKMCVGIYIYICTSPWYYYYNKKYMLAEELPLYTKHVKLLYCYYIKYN